MYPGAQSTIIFQPLQATFRALRENTSKDSQNLCRVLRENASNHHRKRFGVLRGIRELCRILRRNALKHLQELCRILCENASNHHRKRFGVLRGNTPKHTRELCKILRESALKHPQELFRVPRRSGSLLTTVTLLMSPVLILTVSVLRVICEIPSPQRGPAADRCVVFPLTLPFSIPPSHWHLRVVRRLNPTVHQGDVLFLKCQHRLRLSTA